MGATGLESLIWIRNPKPYPLRGRLKKEQDVFDYFTFCFFFEVVANVVESIDFAVIELMIIVISFSLKWLYFLKESSKRVSFRITKKIVFTLHSIQ